MKVKSRVFSSLVSEKFLPGFAWAVGREFLDAVRLCTFNDGDVLYSRRNAYDGWFGISDAAPMIQVLRTDTRSTASFEENWFRQVWIEAWTPDGKSKRMDCPAGCLFHALETGEVGCLEIAEPGESPIGCGKEIRKALKKVDGLRGVFAVPFDLAVQESVWKIRRIGREFGQDPEVVTPVELGVRVSARPTVHIALMDLTPLSDEQFRERLRLGINPHAKSVAPGRHGVQF